MIASEWFFYRANHGREQSRGANEYEKVKKNHKKCQKRIASVFVVGTYLVWTLFLKRKKGPSVLWGFSNGFSLMGSLVGE